MDLTIIIPFYNGHQETDRLLATIPDRFHVIIVDDCSDEPYQLNTDRTNIEVMQLKKKGYFTGAVNAGIRACVDDVLILNQDTHFTGLTWYECLQKNRGALIGERIGGDHPAFPNGYIHGTFMYIPRSTINQVGLLNEVDYPLWGSTCEYQLRVHRENLPVQMLDTVPDFVHARRGNFGKGIRKLLRREPQNQALLIRTPPMVSVVVSCYNYGRYLPDCVNSFIGGYTCMGQLPQQSFASFELIIVDDASIDQTPDWCAKVADASKGVRYIRRSKRGGTAIANNTGIAAAHGKYIAVMCADDMRKPGSLEKLYRAQLANPHSFIYDGIMPFSEGVERPDLDIRVSAYNFEALLYRNHVHSAIMFPKAAWEEIGGYPEAFGDGREDWAINIALGIKGWCGVYLPEKGMWYRREGQGRTMINTSPIHHAKFLAKLQATFPDIYGGNRPMACCGSKSPTVVKAVRKTAPILASTDNAVIVEYIGSNYGTQSYYGIATGARYRAGLTRNFVPVDQHDLSGTQTKPGLLDLREGGKPVFKLYKPPAPTVIKEEVAQTQPEPTQPESYLPIDQMSLKQIKMMERETFDPDALLKLEREGRNRKTVIDYLSQL